MYEGLHDRPRRYPSVYASDHGCYRGSKERKKLSDLCRRNPLEDGNKLLEFKGGSFKAATKAKCPIIPIALIDSFKPFDTNSIAPVTVQVHFLEPIYYEEYQNMKTTEIAKEVKEE